MGKAIFDKGIKITNGQDVTTTPTYLTATNTNGDIEKTDPIQFAGNSAGAISGFEITNNGNGTVSIATGIAILRSANNTTSPLVKYTIPAQTNISLTDNANNFLLVNYNGGTPNISVTTNPTTINTTTNSIIYVVSRVGTNLDYIALIGQNVDVNAKLRRRFLNSEGLTRAQGGVLTASNRNLLVTIGLFYSGLIEVTTPSFNTSSIDTFTQAYLNTNWNRTTGLSQINNTQYNLAGTLTTLPNNAYRVDYVYLLADNPSKLYVILGDAHYNSLADARLAPVPSSLPTELQYLGTRIGRVIIQKNASTMEVSSEFTTIYASGSATLHNDLGGLNVGDYQHLTASEKASIITASGTTNRIPKFNSSNTLGDSVLIQVGGNLGMGSAVVPGELFHIGDGNILLEGGGEVAQKFKRDFSTTGENLGVPTGSGVSVNPIFQIGRIIQAGDGDPEIRIMYSDDNTTERTVFEVDRKGIVASVKTAIGSHYEGFASLTDVNPMFRLNSYPRMRLEMGAGGNNVTDVAVERGASGELAFFTNSTKQGEFDSSGNLSIITTPTTSASGYDILTRNTSTGKVEKIASSGLGGDMLLGTAQTVSALKTFLNGTLGLRNVANTFTSLFTNTNTATRTYTLPDKSMTVAGLVDIPFTTTGNDISNSNTGNIGIGNPSPSYKLDVKGVATTGIERVVNISSVAQYGGIVIDNNKAGGTGQSFVSFAKNGNLTFNFGSDYLINGTKDFFIFDQTRLKSPLYFSSTGDIRMGGDAAGNTEKFTIKESTGNIGIGITSPTAKLNIAAGTATANTAPLKFTAGTNLTTTEAGTLEYNGTHLYFTATNGGARYQLDQQNTVGSVVRLAQYTVATLPTGVQGDNTYVTDALAPTYMATVVGGGSVVTPVFYNGSSWIAH
jgi:hypothetical protein